MSTIDVLDADGVRQTIAKVPNTGPTVPQADRGAVTALLEGDPLATAAGQTTGNATLASILAKLPTGGATDATLAQVRDAIKAQIDVASTIWTDNTGAYYVRRDLVNEGTGAITVAFTAPDGTTATPGAGLRPLATVDRDVTQALFDVITTGTGYTAGDLLARVAIIDANAATPTVTAIWVNLTTAAVISAPTSGHIERADETIGARQVGTWNVGVSALPATAATAANQDTANTRLASIDADIGAVTDAAAPANGAGDYNLIQAAKRKVLNWASLLGRLPTALGQSNMAGSLSVVVASNQTAIPISTGLQSAAGTITTQNLNTGGTATANSAVELLSLNAATVLVQITGTYSGRLIPQYTIDGTNWVTPITNTAVWVVSTMGGSTDIPSGSTGVFLVPTFGAAGVRITAPSAVTGTATVSIRSNPAAMFPQVANVSLGNSTNRIGLVYAGNVATTETTTPLAANATFTGSRRDNNIGGGVNGSSAMETRIAAESDVAGTLWIEYTLDTVNYRRFRSVATSAVTGGGQYAEIIFRPIHPWFRVGYDNGGSAQSRLHIVSNVMSLG